jgi:hypothetical protein
MNEFLAQMYGTAETIGSGDDTEKLAQAQVMNEMFTAEGVDVDSLAPETIVKVAEALFGENTKIAEEDVKKDDEEEEEEEEAEEKLAEADFLGRVMAHSYVNEMTEIEKNAGRATRAVEAVERAGGKIKHLIGQKRKAMGASYEGGKSFFRTRATPARGGGPKGHKMFLPRDKASRLGGSLEVARKHPGTVGGAALLAGGGVAGAGYGAKKGYEAIKGKKKESALDVLAEQRAMEILAENGYAVNGEEKLASAVEERAYQMLAEAGYIK